MSGERVCIHAVASGVGLAALQLVHATGAQSVGTGRTKEKLERAREYGLDELALTDKGAEAFVERVKEWTNGAGVDCILDLVGASMFAANLEALGVRGRLLLVGTLGGSRGEINWQQMMRKRLHLIGTVLRARSSEEKATATRLFVKHVVPLLASGKVRPVVDSVFAMEDVKRAHERVESNETFGKVVLMID